MQRGGSRERDARRALLIMEIWIYAAWRYAMDAAREIYSSCRERYDQAIGVWICVQGTNKPRSYGDGYRWRPRSGWSSPVGISNEGSHLDYLDL